MLYGSKEKLIEGGKQALTRSGRNGGEGAAPSGESTPEAADRQGYHSERCVQENFAGREKHPEAIDVRLRTDRGPQYDSESFRQNMKILRIKQEFMAVNTPEQNGRISMGPGSMRCPFPRISFALKGSVSSSVWLKTLQKLYCGRHKFLVINHGAYPIYA